MRTDHLERFRFEPRFVILVVTDAVVRHISRLSAAPDARPHSRNDPPFRFITPSAALQQIRAR